MIYANIIKEIVMIHKIEKIFFIWLKKSDIILEVNVENEYMYVFDILRFNNSEVKKKRHFLILDYNLYSNKHNRNIISYETLFEKKRIANKDSKLNFIKRLTNKHEYNEKTELFNEYIFEVIK